MVRLKRRNSLTVVRLGFVLNFLCRFPLTGSDAHFTNYKTVPLIDGQYGSYLNYEFEKMHLIVSDLYDICSFFQLTKVQLPFCIYPCDSNIVEVFFIENFPFCILYLNTFDSRLA